MKRARDIRDQLEALLDRVEIEIVSNPGETDKIRLVILSASWLSYWKNASLDGRALLADKGMYSWRQLNASSLLILLLFEFIMKTFCLVYGLEENTF